MRKKLIAILCVSLCITVGSLWFHQHFANNEPVIATHNELHAQDKKTIVIDAGHGGYDSGSISANGDLEKDITLKIALLTGSLLQENGYNVVYTRTSDEVSWSDQNLDDLSSRVRIAEDNNAAYFISIHTNASKNYDDGAYGFESYLNYTDSTIEKMAYSIDDNLTSLSYSQSRGLKSTEDNSLYVIDKNSVPALLIEVGFITDSDDSAYITSSEGQEQIATAITNGIISSF